MPNIQIAINIVTNDVKCMSTNRDKTRYHFQSNVGGNVTINNKLPYMPNITFDFICVTHRNEGFSILRLLIPFFRFNFPFSNISPYIESPLASFDRGFGRWLVGGKINVILFFWGRGKGGGFPFRRSSTAFAFPIKIWEGKPSLFFI